jgi:hypothetical protein
MGCLEVLNVAGGDVKLTFNRQDVAEAIRAKRMIEDMLQRGYALIVEVDGAYQRVTHFDAAHGEYVVADFDPRGTPQRHDDEERYEPETPQAETSDAPAIAQAEIRQDPPLPKRRGRPSTRLAMEHTHAAAIARSAGG